MMHYIVYFILGIVLFPFLVEFVKNSFSDTPHNIGDYGCPPDGDEIDRFDF